MKFNLALLLIVGFIAFAVAAPAIENEEEHEDAAAKVTANDQDVESDQGQNDSQEKEATLNTEDEAEKEEDDEGHDSETDKDEAEKDDEGHDSETKKDEAEKDDDGAEDESQNAVEASQQDSDAKRRRRRKHYHIIYRTRYLYPPWCSPHWKIFRRCEHKSGVIKCPRGRLIWIGYANYGRTTGPSVCPHRSVSKRVKYKCRSSYSSKLTRCACHGQSSCFLFAKNQVYGDPCRRTYKYIEVKYKCVLARFFRRSG